MHLPTALLLTVFYLLPPAATAQESVQDWSKKVIELQEKEGQNFEQDLMLLKGFLYLQRRSEALTLIGHLSKGPFKKDPRLIELSETAADQFFFQESAELYADAVQLLRSENVAEAKDKVESAIQKEGKHRLLTMRAIQAGLALGQFDSVGDYMKTAESFYSEFTIWKVYSSWIALAKNEAKEAYRILLQLWNSDRALFEKNEAVVLAFLQSADMPKRPVDWIQLSKIIQKHPEWAGVRLWRLKNKNFTESERKKESDQLLESLNDIKKLKEIREKQEKESSYYFSGLINLEKVKIQLEELLAPKPQKN